MSRYQKTTRRFKNEPVNDFKKAKPKFATLIICLVALLLVPTTVFFTLAYKTDATEEVTNEFNPKEVVIDIVEHFNGAVKNNVKIDNTGEVDAYIRFKISISAVDSNGDTVAMPITVINGNEKTYRAIDIDDFDITALDWADEFLQIGDMYYCRDLVEVTGSVPLFTQAKFNKDMLAIDNDIALPLTDASGNPYYIIENKQLKSKTDEDGNLIAYNPADLTTAQKPLEDGYSYMTSNYTPVLTIVAESIQANGVVDSWPVKMNVNGTLSSLKS